MRSGLLLFPIVFFAALLTTLILTPAVRKFSQSVGALDTPSARKVHSFPIPRAGGISLYFGVLFSILIALPLSTYLGRGIDKALIIVVLLGSTLMAILGLLDDLKNIPAGIKFLIQVAIISLMVIFGIRITFITNPFDTLIPLGFLSFPLTILWIVGITNAVNLIDGLDGLAAGVSSICAGTLFILALRTHQIDAALLVVALMGASLGFLHYNFHPATIFLGDSGSLFLGFILAVASVVGVLKSTLVIALLVPVMVLGVPIYDTAAAILRRLRGGQPIFRPDKKHLHHRLLDAGFSQTEAVLLIYLVTFILCGGALLVTAINAAWVYLLVIGMATAGFFLIRLVKDKIKTGE
jgi:UDP-GlcNAc:undecaprenyl-phosphate GlcNAc-1-phosphate transferase